MFDKKLLESAELYDKRYKNFATLIIFPVLILFVGILIFSLFAKKELIVTSRGSVMPVKVVAQIQSTSNNLITRNKLEEGKRIKKNEELIRYNSESDTTQLNSLIKQSEQLQIQKDQLSLLENSLMEDKDCFTQSDSYGYEQTFLNYQAQVQTTKEAIEKDNHALTDQNKAIANNQSTLNNQVNEIEKQITEYKEIQKAVSKRTKLTSNNSFKAQFDAYQNQLKTVPKGEDNDSQKETIKAQFLASLESNLNQLQSQKQAITAQSSGLIQSNNFDYSLSSQLTSLKAQALQNANKEGVSIETNLLEINTKIALQKQTDKEAVLLASEDGVIHVLPNVLGVRTIPVGTPMAEIYPELKREVQVKLISYIPSSLISGIKKNQKMRFTVQQNLPKPEILEGKVTEIDSAPTSDDAQNYYKVQAVVKLKSEDLPKIKYGLQGKVVIVIGDKTYFDYYKDLVSGKR